MTLAPDAPSPLSRTLVTVGEIAEIAGVGPSAVSNWTARHENFPAEVESGLFDRDEVVEWLRRNGKEVRLPARTPVEETLWRIANEPRGDLGIQEMPELVLQVMTLRAASAGTYPRLAELSDAWGGWETKDASAGGAWLMQLSEDLTTTDPELARALRPARTARELRGPVSGLRDLFGQMDAVETDWGSLATGVIEGFVARYGVRAGEHSTAGGLVDVMIALLDPLEGTVYDPACGAGVFLTTAWRRYGSSIEHVYGQEINERSWRLGFLHLLLNRAPFEIVTGNTLLDDGLWSLRADRISAEPPLGQVLRRGDFRESDPRWTPGGPSPQSADLAWAQHVIYHLGEDGIGVIVVSPGALFRGGMEAEIRGGFLDSDVLDAVIQLPPGVMPTTSISPCLLLYDRRRSNRSGQVLFIDARQLGRPQRGGLRLIRDDEITRIAHTVRSWRRGGFEGELQFAGAALDEEIRSAGMNLTPNRYVGYARIATEIDGEPLSDRLGRLAKTLDDQSRMLPTVLSDVQRQLSGIDVLADPEVGRVVRLEEVLTEDPVSGVRQREPDEEGDVELDTDPVPYVSTAVVSAGVGTLERAPGEFTWGDPGQRLTSPGDLLLVSRGVERVQSVGCATVRFETPAAFSESLIRLRVNAEVADPDYVRLYLTSRQGTAALAAAATGSVISNLRRTALKDVEISLPPIMAQRVVGAAMRQIESGGRRTDELAEAMRALHDTLREGFAAGLFSSGDAAAHERRRQDSSKATGS